MRDLLGLVEGEEKLREMKFGEVVQWWMGGVVTFVLFPFSLAQDTPTSAAMVDPAGSRCHRDSDHKNYFLNAILT